MWFIIFCGALVGLIALLFGLGLYCWWGGAIVPFSPTPLNLILLVGGIAILAAGTAMGLIADNRRRGPHGARHSAAAISGWSAFVGFSASILTNLSLHLIVVLRATLPTTYAIALAGVGVVLVTTLVSSGFLIALRVWTRDGGQSKVRNPAATRNSKKVDS